MRTLHYIKTSHKEVYRKCYKQIAIAFLAADRFMKNELKFKNDLDERALYLDMCSKNRDKSSAEYKRNLIKEGMIAPLMAMALHCMYVNPDVIYNTIIKAYLDRIKSTYGRSLVIKDKIYLDMIDNPGKYDMVAVTSRLNDSSVEITPSI